MKRTIFILLLCAAYVFNLSSQIKVTNSNKIGIGIAPDNNYSITMNGDVFIKGAYNNYIRLLTSAGSGGPYVDISPSNNQVGCSYLGYNNPWDMTFTKYLYVYSNLTLNGSFYNYSDKNIKKDVDQLIFNKDLFAQLKPVSYNMVDSLNMTKKNGEKIVFKFEKKEYPIKGFIAQELQKIYPELVEEDGETGLLKIKPLEFIPILVKAIQSQQEEINALFDLYNKSYSALKKVADSAIESDTNPLTYAVLEQNTPNPFNVLTSIAYYLPVTISNASIYVYDMNGVQLKNYKISVRGKGNITIQGSELNAGMYLYALIADGKVIDTKRMILTK